MEDMPDELRNVSFAAFLLIGSGAALVGWGFYTMFSEAELVGGDAYNFIIFAVRGVGYIVTGGIVAFLGGVAAVAHEHQRTRWIIEHSAKPRASPLSPGAPGI